MRAQTRTVLFTDTEASTEFSLDHGDETAVALMRIHEGAVREPVEREGGTVVKNTGDGFLAVFPTTDGGVRAALDIRKRLEGHNATHPDAPLRVRFGLHTGDVIQDLGDVFGLAVSTAARITSKARTGQLLVSEQVRAAVTDPPTWTFSDRGSFWLKGLREQWRLYEVLPAGETSAAAPALGNHLPFVGRDAERARLRLAVDEANAGHGALIFVAGTAGSGKSRLAEEVGVEASERGLHFVLGRCTDTTQADPYAALVEVAESLERRMSASAFRVLLGDSAGEMARLLPHLRQRFSDVPPAAEPSSVDTRRYFFTGLQEVLARLAGMRPLVLMLDDLHWADVPTLLFLEHLAADLAELPILVLATYNVEAVSNATPLHATLARLHQRQSVRAITLGPFSRGDLVDLLTEVGASAPPDDLVDAVQSAAEGNAFFTAELVRQLVEQGQVLNSNGWRPDMAAIDLEVPEGVRFVIESRLAKLEPGTRTALTTASLLGRDFGFDLLEVLSDLGEDALLDAVDEAERAHLIVSSIEDQGVRFAFEHELIRKTLVRQLSHTRLQRLHLRVADALEAVHASTVAAHAAAIAFHLEQAGHAADPARRIRFLTLAADRDLDSAAFENAVRHLDQALSLIDAADASARAPLLERLAAAQRSLGQPQAALTSWEGALDAFEAIGASADVERVALDAAIQVAWWRRGDDVARLVRRGFRAGGAESSATRAGLITISGMMASQSGLDQEGEELLTEALVMAKRHGSDRVIGLALYGFAVHCFAYQRFQEAIELGLESTGYLRQASDRWNLANALGYVGASYGWIGRFAEAAEIGREGEELALRLGNWSAFAFAEQARGFQSIGEQPSAPDLEQRGRRALELGEEMGFSWLCAVGHTRLGLASFWRGAWDEALNRFEEAARLEMRGVAGGHLGRLILVNVYLGNRAAAVELIDQARPSFPELGRSNSGTAWGLAASSVEALAMLGQRDQAAALYPTVNQLAATGIVLRTWDFRLIATLQGIAAGAGGEWDTAEQHFVDSLRLSGELPMRHEEPEACRFYAQMLLGKGGPDARAAAGDLVDRAITGYDEFMMSGHATMARALATST